MRTHKLYVMYKHAALTYGVVYPLSMRTRFTNTLVNIEKYIIYQNRYKLIKFKYNIFLIADKDGTDIMESIATTRVPVRDIQHQLSSKFVATWFTKRRQHGKYFQIYILEHVCHRQSSLTNPQQVHFLHQATLHHFSFWLW